MELEKQPSTAESLVNAAITPFVTLSLFLVWLACGAVIAHFWSDCDVIGKLIWVIILSGWILLTPLVVSILFSLVSMGAQMQGQMNAARFFSKAAFQLYWTSTLFLSWTGKSSFSLPALTYQAVLLADCRFKEAEQVTSDLVSFFEQKFGKDSKPLAAVLTLHTKSLMVQGKLREALEGAKRVEAIYRKTNDFSHPDSIWRIAEIYRCGGQYSVAEQYHKESIEICLIPAPGLEGHEKLNELAEGRAAIFRFGYASALYKLGNLAGARAQIEKALSCMGAENLKTTSASVFAQAAIVAAKQNRMEKADEYFKEATTRYEKYGRDNKLELFDEFELLGEYAMIRNRFEESETLYKKSLALSKEVGLENSVLMMLTLEGYAELLRKMHRDQEAIKIQQRFEEILKHATEELSPTISNTVA